MLLQSQLRQPCCVYIHWTHHRTNDLCRTDLDFVHKADPHCATLDAGFSSRNGTSPQDTASRDAENSTVGGDQDCEVFYDAVSILAPWETLAAQEFWDNLETEPSSDNPWTGAASSTRDSKHVTFCLTQPTRRRRSPPQVRVGALLSAHFASCPVLMSDCIF